METNAFQLEDIGPEKMFKIMNSDDMRLTNTPFGTSPAEPDKIVVSSAVPWKNEDGGTQGNLSDILKKYGVDEGLSNAIKISKKCEGEKGVTVHNGEIVPKKVVCQQKKGGGS